MDDEAEEKWGVCAECSVLARESELTDGLCYWCTPEGKQEEARFLARLFTSMKDAGAEEIDLPNGGRGPVN